MFTDFQYCKKLGQNSKDSFQINLANRCEKGAANKFEAM